MMLIDINHITYMLSATKSHQTCNSAICNGEGHTGSAAWLCCLAA